MHSPWLQYYACVNYSTAIEDEDFAPTDGFISFLDGQSSVVNNETCVSITILNDEILEDNEEFIVIVVGSGLVNVIDGQVVVKIHEDPSDCEYHFKLAIPVTIDHRST